MVKCEGWSVEKRETLNNRELLLLPEAGAGCAAHGHRRRTQVEKRCVGRGRRWENSHSFPCEEVSAPRRTFGRCCLVAEVPPASLSTPLNCFVFCCPPGRFFLFASTSPEGKIKHLVFFVRTVARPGRKAKFPYDMC